MTYKTRRENIREALTLSLEEAGVILPPYRNTVVANEVFLILNGLSLEGDQEEKVGAVAYYLWEENIIPYGYRFAVAHRIVDEYDRISPVGNECLDGIILE